MAPLHEDRPARLAVASILLLLLTAGPGLAAEPQKAPPAKVTPVPPLALSTPVPPPPSRDKGVVSKTKRLNLWPFLYYRHDPVGQTYQFNLIGPMLRFGGTPEENTFALSPLLFSRKDKKTSDSVIEFLWPYGRFKSEGGETETRLLPFLEGDKDESPSFAPNSDSLIYATRQGRNGVLETVSADGLVRQRLASRQGDVREPVWSPYPRF